MSVYIGNLSYKVNEEDVREVFTEYGSVTRVSLPVDKETGRKRGFGFVEMETEADEDKAIDELDGAEWMDRILKVNKAKPREQRSNNKGFSRSRY
ncbi:RNA-binding protein [Roseofilum reptotaenium CS-1145]|uniref:RNA-binding protein n=1 Tax=Roseofilum reptotaenium AO1-A TaxID=1925591 RepID=A0A1L9QKT5_9CYAN|nr:MULTISPECIES: RNA-binding protein [Roseofilum]MBP0031179.1 RNA-binding protein [Roseofilum sp. Guam]MDB9517787.1 RNA-binding protein [Roseofilum reptotaenium CS-1145]OJJ18123.1 RNA-binding protein [Roseofilum reptotaenium AO1-A]